MAALHPGFIQMLDQAAADSTTAFAQDWRLLQEIIPHDAAYLIEQYVDAKHLACPLPLLKLKMALKSTQLGNTVYVTATDPNSQQDIAAFCRHTGQDYQIFSTALAGSPATIFHLLITKRR